jgi:hypothetical protein
MDLVESGLKEKNVFIKGRTAEIFGEFRKPESTLENFKGL